MTPVPSAREQLIRSRFDEYIEMYSARDDRLTTRFSENFSGYAGADDTLVTNRDEWIRITRLDFAQVPGRVGIEMLAIALQDLGADVVAVTAFFHIHLPIPESILARETARLVLIFRLEGDDWMIAHSGISIPFGRAGAGEVYPMLSLLERNRRLESLVEERTQALAEANDRLQTLSDTDALTAIANRRRFDRILAQEWDRGQRAAAPLALIMIDVDLFKHYNDEYGHVAGDHCLRRLAEAIAGAGQRVGDLAARYGGEEFVVLLPDTDEEGAMETAHRIQQEIWSLALTHSETQPGIVTASFGVASVVPSRSHSADDLLRLADAALYRAKHTGRNCVRAASG